MADVYLAVDTTNPVGTPEPVALKVIRTAHGLTPEGRRRFTRECELLGRLRHPNIVDLLDHGEDHDRLWLALRYVPGASAAALRQRRPELLTPEAVVAVTRRIADALDYAHRRKVIHRDVKPANILVTVGPDGAISGAVLADFGIAKAIDTSGVQPTATGVGTSGFTAPEVIRDRGSGPAADQYSLACTTFELLTGESPFRGDSIAARMHSQLHEPPRSIGSVSSLSPQLDAIFRRGLATDPGDRFGSCREFVEAVAIAAGLRTIPAGAGIGGPDTDLPGPPTVARPPRRGPVLLAGVLVAVLLVALGTTWWLSSGGDRNGPPVSDGASSLALGDGFACQVRDGAVSCWGDNSWGQLGIPIDGDIGDQVLNVSNQPQEPFTGWPGQQAVSVAAGQRYACTVTTLAEVYCWGQANPEPRQIELAHAVRTVAVGSSHACALDTAGSVWCWETTTADGRGEPGPAPEGTPELVPDAEPMAAIAMHEWTICAVTETGTAVCWGDASDHRTGTGRLDQIMYSPKEVGGSLRGRTVSAIAVGENGACAVSGEEIHCWGAAFADAAAGIGTAPRHIVSAPVSSSGTALAVGGHHGCAIAPGPNAAVVCWGSANRGQLGNTDFGPEAFRRDTPVDVFGIAGATEVSAFGDTTCAVLNDGNTACWGDNTTGQLGYDGDLSSSDPVAVVFE